MATAKDCTLALGVREGKGQNMSQTPHHGSGGSANLTEEKQAGEFYVPAEVPAYLLRQEGITVSLLSRRFASYEEKRTAIELLSLSSTNEELKERITQIVEEKGRIVVSIHPAVDSLHVRWRVGTLDTDTFVAHPFGVGLKLGHGDDINKKINFLKETLEEEVMYIERRIRRQHAFLERHYEGKTIEERVRKVIEKVGLPPLTDKEGAKIVCDVANWPLVKEAWGLWVCDACGDIFWRPAELPVSGTAQHNEDEAVMVLKDWESRFEVMPCYCEGEWLKRMLEREGYKEDYDIFQPTLLALLIPSEKDRSIEMLYEKWAEEDLEDAFY